METHDPNWDDLFHVPRVGQDAIPTLTRQHGNGSAQEQPRRPAHEEAEGDEREPVPSMGSQPRSPQALFATSRPAKRKFLRKAERIKKMQTRGVHPGPGSRRGASIVPLWGFHAGRIQTLRSATDLLVLMCICACAANQDRPGERIGFGECYPTEETLAFWGDRDVKSVKRSIHALANRGLIKVRRRHHPDGTWNNIYQVVWEGGKPHWWAAHGNGGGAQTDG
jgi:hypothetical protein